MLHPPLIAIQQRRVVMSAAVVVAIAVVVVVVGVLSVVKVREKQMQR
jgi:heme/copper-type cytochrome/quinol oxidase subunit 2